MGEVTRRFGWGEVQQSGAGQRLVPQADKGSPKETEGGRFTMEATGGPEWHLNHFLPRITSPLRRPGPGQRIDTLSQRINGQYRNSG